MSGVLQPGGYVQGTPTNTPGGAETSVLGGADGLDCAGNQNFIFTVRNPIGSGGPITALHLYKSPNDPADLTEDTTATMGLVPIPAGSVVWFALENEPLGKIRVTVDSALPLTGIVVSVRGGRGGNR